MEQTQFEKDSAALAASSLADPNKDANGNPFPEQLSASTQAEAKHEKALLTSDELDAHVSAGNAVVQSAVVPHLPNPTVAAIYQVARPVLLLAQSLLFFKPGWAKAIKGLIAVLDVEFPTASN